MMLPQPLLLLLLPLLTRAPPAPSSGCALLTLSALLTGLDAEEGCEVSLPELHARLPAWTVLMLVHAAMLLICTIVLTLVERERAS